MIVRYDIITYHDVEILINSSLKLVNPVCHTVKAARVWLVKRFIAVGNMKDGVKDTIRTCGMFTEEWRRAGIFRRSHEAIANMVLIGCLHTKNNQLSDKGPEDYPLNYKSCGIMLFVVPAKFIWFSLTEGNRLSRCARVLYRPLCYYRNSVKNVLSPMQTILKICASFFSYLAEIRYIFSSILSYHSW